MVVSLRHSSHARRLGWSGWAGALLPLASMMLRSQSVVLGLLGRRGCLLLGVRNVWLGGGGNGWFGGSRCPR